MLVENPYEPEFANLHIFTSELYSEGCKAQARAMIERLEGGHSEKHYVPECGCDCICIYEAGWQALKKEVEQDECL